MSAFRVLGPVEAWTDERRLVLGGPQQVKLLAFLLLNANRALSADAVIDAVWGAGRQGATKRMQMGVSRLRRGLEPLNNPDGPRLRTVSGGYFLSVAPGELDADVFVAQVQDGRAALDAGDPVRARDLLGSALGLWRGAPLAEVAFEDFAQAEIRRLEELRLEALEARIDADLRLRSHARVVGELQALLPEHPTRERLASQLMLALYRCGRQADALEVYQRTRAQLAEELGLEPGPALRTLQMQILAQAPSLKPALDGEINGSPRTDPEPGPSGHVPRSPTPLIAREQELETVCRLLQDADVRLVTLTGTGGVGKTRLALAIAHRLESSFPDGVCWVELAGVSGPQDVGSTVTRALSLTPLPGESATDALGRHLASKRLLLVIDNFEHVLEAAILVAELHRSTAEVVLLITSREALNLAGEHQFLVAPLAVPVSSKTVTVAELETSAASALFLAAARRRNGRFAISPTAAPAVAEICARLDGLPLALELAAARTTVLSITELMTRLKDAVTDLGAAPRDAPVRQRTLHATLEWSYQMLDEALQRAFVRFAVFAGGATLDAACGVTGAALEVLDALIAKSLIDRRQQPDGSTRLVMLETVRHYAQQRLAHDPERDVVSLRHLEYYLQIAERADGKLDTHDEAEALQLLDGEIDNIGAALRWGQGRDPDSALRLAGQIGGYWLIRGDGEALVWLDQALQAAGEQASPEDRARVQLRRAQMLFSRQQHEAAGSASEQALLIYQQADDHAGVGRALSELAGNTSILGDAVQARAYAEAACLEARTAGDDRLLGIALASLASLLPSDERLAVLEQAAELLADAGAYRGLAGAYLSSAYHDLMEDAPSQALALLDLALPAAARVDSPFTTMLIFGNFGLAHLFLGELTRAREAFDHQLRLCLGHAFIYGADEGLIGLAAVSAGDGNDERAARLLAAARAMGYPPAGDQPIDDHLERDYFASARARHGEAAWRRAEKTGALLSYDQAIAYALAQASETASPSIGRGSAGTPIEAPRGRQPSRTDRV